MNDRKTPTAYSGINRDVFTKILNGVGGLNNRHVLLCPPTGSWGQKFPPLTTIRVRGVTETGTVAVVGQLWGTLRPFEQKATNRGADPDGIWSL